MSASRRSTRVPARPGPAASPEPDRHPLLTTHARVAASLARIAKGSRLWREEVDALRGSGRQAIVVTSDEVAVIDARSAGAPQPFDATILAEVTPIVEHGSEVRTVLVIVNLALLDNVHERRDSLPAERDLDLDRILVHEVYGHALPYLRAGHVSGRCADPLAGEPAASACSIVRENAVSAELGFGQRTDYGLNGLLLSRYAGPTPGGLAMSVRVPR